MRCFRFKTLINSNCSKKFTVISRKLIFFAQYLFVLHFLLFCHLFLVFCMFWRKKGTLCIFCERKYTKTTCFYRIYKVFHSFRKENREKLLFSRIYNFYQFFRSKLIKQGWRHLRINCAPTFAHARLRMYIFAHSLLRMYICMRKCKCASIANP